LFYLLFHRRSVLCLSLRGRLQRSFSLSFGSVDLPTYLPTVSIYLSISTSIHAYLYSVVPPLLSPIHLPLLPPWPPAALSLSLFFSIQSMYIHIYASIYLYLCLHLYMLTYPPPQKQNTPPLSSPTRPPLLLRWPPAAQFLSLPLSTQCLYICVYIHVSLYIDICRCMLFTSSFIADPSSASPSVAACS